MSARLVSILLSLGAVFAANPIVLERGPAPEALFAIGDVHGDAQRLSVLLAAAHLADGARWSGGRSVLVLTGDMIDKGPNSVGVLRLVSALRTAALKDGGEVIALAGNHEAEFLADPKGKKSEEFRAELKAAQYDPVSVASCETDMGEFLCSLPFAARVGEWFFSHGGNTGGRSIGQLQQAIRAGMAADRYSTQELIGPTSILEARLGEGKKWFDSADEHQLLASYASALGVKHMVQGHQHNEVRFRDGEERKTGEMFQRWGLLFLIDVGMSRDVDDSFGAVLHVVKGNASAICAGGKETVLWREGAAVDVGRAAPCR